MACAVVFCGGCAVDGGLCERVFPASDDCVDLDRGLVSARVAVCGVWRSVEFGALGGVHCVGVWWSAESDIGSRGVRCVHIGVNPG